MRLEVWDVMVLYFIKQALHICMQPLKHCTNNTDQLIQQHNLGHNVQIPFSSHVLMKMTQFVISN